jgi:PAS domain S-box-containing protein
VEKVPELPAGEALERLLGAACPDAVVVADRDGVIRHWNAAATRLFGHAAADAVGRSLDLIIPERLRARHRAGWDEVMRTGSTRYGDDLLKVPSQHADGRPLSLEFRVVLVRDAGGAIAGVAAFLRDVTATWQELRALRARVAALERGGS